MSGTAGFHFKTSFLLVNEADIFLSGIGDPFLICKFSKIAFAEGFSLELEYQLVFIAILDCFPYFGRSQQFCSLDGIDSSNDFRLFL